MDTIFALATAPGRSGVSVIRVSGPDAFAVCEGLCGSLPPARRVRLSDIRDPETEDILDRGLVVTFPGPSSFTGEDVVEFHVHGSIAVQQAVLGVLSRRPGLRMAEPGEFTRRAFENERLDLTEVEALSDLIEAETDMQRRQAQRTLSGALSTKVEGWRADLIRAAALIEATIDFADEDVPEDVTPEVSDLLNRVRADLLREVQGSRIAERVRTGFEVAIVGAPNVGKSTLLNFLAGREAAITSEIAGTTRDVIEVRMDLRGLPVTILDTAGLRESGDRIEKIGISRAIERARVADLCVVLKYVDQKLPLVLDPDDIVVVPKADLSGKNVGLAVSGLTGLGVDELVDLIEERLKSRVSGLELASRERHRVAMSAALENLGAAFDLLRAGTENYDVAAEELRVASRSLERLIGRIDVECLLEEIFANFCLGK